MNGKYISSYYWYFICLTKRHHSYFPLLKKVNKYKIHLKISPIPNQHPRAPLSLNIPTSSVQRNPPRSLHLNSHTIALDNLEKRLVAAREYNCWRGQPQLTVHIHLHIPTHTRTVRRFACISATSATDCQSVRHCDVSRSRSERERRRRRRPLYRRATRNQLRRITIDCCRGVGHGYIRDWTQCARTRTRFFFLSFFHGIPKRDGERLAALCGWKFYGRA